MNYENLRIPELAVDEITADCSNEIAAQKEVRSVLVLPDGFVKDKYIHAGYKVTIPSSSVIVSNEDVLYPQFRSRGIGCGMAVVALPVYEEDLDAQLVSSLSRSLTYNYLYYIAYRLRLPIFPGSVDLSYSDFISIVAKDDEAFLSLKKQLSEKWFTKRTVRLRRCFGRYFGGNHFFELSSCEQLVSELGLQPGQLVATFHTGCQGLEALIPENLREQYLYQSVYTSTSSGEPMYDAFFRAQDVLENYVSAYRNATKTLVDQALQNLGLPCSELIVDQSHNSVSRLNMHGQNSLVYRHNAVPLIEKQWSIVSGNYDHRSYLVRGGSNTSETCQTIDHGLGYILKSEKEKHYDLDNKVCLKRFRNGIHGMESEREINLTQSAFAKSYMDLMVSRNIVNEFVSLRPIVNIKYN